MFILMYVPVDRTVSPFGVLPPGTENGVAASPEENRRDQHARVPQRLCV